MGNTDLLSGLSLFTILAVVAVALFVYLRFVRKPQNRHPMEGPRADALDERRAGEHGQPLRDPPPTRQEPRN